MQNRRSLQGAVLAVALTLAVTAAGSVIRVPDDYPTIALGLAHATAGDSVVVIQIEYDEYDLVIPAGVHLLSHGPGGGSAVIDAQGLGRVLTIEGGDTRLQDLQLKNGVSQFQGGGVRVDAGNTILENVEIRHCTANNGAGLAVTGGAVELIDCRIHSNLARTTGGAIHAVEASVAIDGSVLAFNEAGAMGGAWYLALSELAIDGSTVAFNVAPEGAEGTAFGADPVVMGQTIAARNAPDGPVDLRSILLTDFASRLDNTCVLRWQPGIDLWPGYLAEQLDDPERGNQQLDPLFCDLPGGLLEEVLGLAADSPALPQPDGCGLKGAYGVMCEPVDAPGVGVLADRLERAYPNPFNPSTTIAFAVAHTGPVKLTIYGLDGRRVTTLVDEALPAGEHQRTWLGRDDRGRTVASGVYLARLVTGQSHHAIRLTLVK
ncbi:T9SS type A sorting domain-containing protein [bacterium]|nr:T9SS type A sorting domain-containing protein [bacterium]